ncbi:bifunctional glycosyltransferase family 2/GtrA family protein [Microbacterium sp. 1P10UB]|uniref:glycosyltransferase n=1 Tax=unclassified Microbacterium TaxID=2609290 RepID=UPI00399F0AEE
MIVLIPAYEPGEHLVPLVRDLLDQDPDAEVLIVDDGSGSAFAERFAAAQRAGARLLAHPVNRGKGAALKTGLRDVEERRPGDDVVTADADGQHTARDILRVADALRVDSARGASELVLGARGFRGEVPFRSRIGNAISRALFRVAAGWGASDTQTGLRGIPVGMLPWLREVPGDRFEYEIEMLLRLGKAGFTAREIPIETVYLAQNASSHFRPLMDSLRVTLPLLLFAASSLLAFLVDTVALLVLQALTGSLVASIVGARLVSASVNFAVNRRVVFRSPRTARTFTQALRYTGLAALLLASNVVWMQALTGAGLPLLVAKAATEAVLFVTSYQVQRRFVFGRGAAARRSADVSGRLAPSQERFSSAPDGPAQMDITPRFERTS